ncbi:MAG: hypothetical protein GY937_26085 [bacterium]|nr:hypothetical protein [bacterium]
MTTRITLILVFLLLLPTSAALANHEGLPDPLPGELGEWAVGHRESVIVDADRGDRPLPLRVWYPVDPGDEGSTLAFYPLILGLGLTSDVATESPPVSSRRKRPLIVFSHGSGGFNIQSIQLCETLASHGFIVAAPDHTGNTVLDFQNGTDVPFEQSAHDRPLDISFVIGHLIKRSRTAGDTFEGRVRGHRVGVAGHSFGGYTALAMASGVPDVPPDPRVTAIMPIAPASGILTDAELQSIQSPTLLLSGTFDTTTPIDQETIRPHELIGSSSVYRADIVGADHFHFANICDIASVLIGVGIGPAI